MDSTLRLIASNPVDQLARTLEALLVVASAPLSVAELAEAADDDPERVETALGLLGERYSERRSGIVLEHVAGGYAFRASREASIANTAPTRPSQIAVSKRSKPGRVMPPPERPRSSSTTSTVVQPSCLARSASPYCRLRLSWLCKSWSAVDWRT